MQWFEVFYPQKDKAHWTMEVMKLWDQVAWWAKFNKNVLKINAWLALWME
jgi:hypothetical protein